MGNAQQKHTINLDEEEEEAINFTCEICMEPSQSTKKFRNSNKCIQLFCTDCIKKYIEVKIEERVAKIQCPNLYCKHQLDPIACRSLITETNFEKWCDNLLDSAILGFGEKICYCPNRNCAALIVNECGEKSVRKTKCPNCMNYMCFECKIPWHEGHRCKKSGELMKKEDLLFRELVERKQWTKCPNCRYHVELSGGCKMVTCRCGTRFCHRCGKTHDCNCGDIGGAIVFFIFLLCWLLIFFLILCAH